MAVPSIVRILPVGFDVADAVEGPVAGGQTIEIYGDGFRLPNTAPVDVTVGDVVESPALPSVRVTFGGVAAPVASAVASNRLVVVTPPSPVTLTTEDPVHGTQWGVGTVDVVIENVDDAGDPIAGESVTAVDGYTYRGVKLDSATESDLARLVRTLLLELNRRVLSNVMLTVDVDFDSDTSTALVDIAKLPALVLQGPRLAENRFYSLNGRRASDGYLHRKVHTVDLAFDLVGISNHPVESLNLMALCTEFVESMPFISMARDPSDSAQGEVQYEFDFDGFSGFELANRPNADSLHTFSGSLRIRGFDFEGFAGFTRADVAGLLVPLGDHGVTIDTERFGG